MSTCKWPLGNNETLEFTVYTHDAAWNQTAGLYIFTYLGTDNLWHSLYVGQVDSFADRLPSHEKWSQALQLGATHVHALVVPLEANRDKWEKMLIQHLQPPMNQQFR